METNVMHPGASKGHWVNWRGGVVNEASPEVLSGFSLNSLPLSLSYTSPPALPTVKYTRVGRIQDSYLFKSTFFSLGHSFNPVTLNLNGLFTFWMIFKRISLTFPLNSRLVCPNMDISQKERDGSLQWDNLRKLDSRDNFKGLSTV